MLLVFALVAATLGAVALARSERRADAAVIPNAITDVSLRQETTSISGSFLLELDWSVPNEAQSGDTFSIELPDSLDPSINGFDLLAPDGQVVAVATISGTNVSFTLTGYADVYNAVSGTAFFENRFKRSEVTENGPVSVTFVTSDGVTYTDSIEVTGIGVDPGDPYVVNRSNSRKVGWWTDPKDQGRTDPDGALRWVLESAIGPATSVVFEDRLAGGHATDCGSLTLRLVTEFNAQNYVANETVVDPADYTIDCTDAGFVIDAGDLATGQMFRVVYDTSVTDGSLASYSNEAKVTMGGVEGALSTTVRKSAAGGTGGGTLQPAIDIEKYGTDAGPTDGDADQAPGQAVGASTTDVTMTIRNSGDEPLIDLTVSDATTDGPPLAGLTCDFSALGGPSDGVTWAGPFAAGASFDCRGVLPRLASGGTHANLATVAATGQTSTTPVEDEDPWHATNDSYFDLALRKTTEADLVRVGDVVPFDIEVFNQGTLTATNMTVTDYLPEELGFVTDGNDAWTEANGVVSTVLVGPLAPGESTTVTIDLEVLSWAELIVNTAEISYAEDDEGLPGQDVDSTPNAEIGDDPLVDDEIDSTPTGDPADEDDHDIAVLRAPTFDLALRKTLAVGQPSDVWPGDAVTFTLEVFNQGQQAATDITITDELPEGLEFDVSANPGWQLVDGRPTTVLAGPLAPGDSTSVDLVATVASDAGAGDLVNTAEISAADDESGAPGEDIDSVPDTDLDDDVLLDDEIDATPATGDEDDHDVAPVRIPLFDLALRKTLSPGQASVVEPGSIASFTITVFNQGNIAARNIEVADSLPEGLEFVATGNEGWTESDGVVRTILAAQIEPGERASVQIRLRVVAGEGSSLVNHAEITTATDPEGTPRDDVDSTPDDDPTDDALVDDEIDATPATGDEDDHDIAEISTPGAPKAKAEGVDQEFPASSATGSTRGGNPGGSSSIGTGTIVRTGSSPLGLVVIGSLLVLVGGALVERRRRLLS